MLNQITGSAADGQWWQTLRKHWVLLVQASRWVDTVEGDKGGSWNLGEQGAIFRGRVLKMVSVFASFILKWGQGSRTFMAHPYLKNFASTPLHPRWVRTGIKRYRKWKVQCPPPPPPTVLWAILDTLHCDKGWISKLLCSYEAISLRKYSLQTVGLTGFVIRIIFFHQGYLKVDITVLGKGDPAKVRWNSEMYLSVHCCFMLMGSPGLRLLLALFSAGFTFVMGWWAQLLTH